MATKPKIKIQDNEELKKEIFNLNFTYNFLKNVSFL